MPSSGSGGIAPRFCITDFTASEAENQKCIVARKSENPNTIKRYNGLAKTDREPVFKKKNGYTKKNMPWIREYVTQK
jgi:hypothetical protein